MAELIAKMVFVKWDKKYKRLMRTDSVKYMPAIVNDFFKDSKFKTSEWVFWITPNEQEIINFQKIGK